jgi:hypothetical protein
MSNFPLQKLLSKQGEAFVICIFLDIGKSFFKLILMIVFKKHSHKLPFNKDQINTNLSLSLKEVLDGLNTYPAYVSREFSKN